MAGNHSNKKVHKSISKCLIFNCFSCAVLEWVWLRRMLESEWEKASIHYSRKYEGATFELMMATWYRWRVKWLRIVLITYNVTSFARASAENPTELDELNWNQIMAHFISFYVSFLGQFIAAPVLRKNKNYIFSKKKQELQLKTGSGL